MKLIDKFKQWLDTNPRVQIREVQIEIIADEFAIGFGEWLYAYKGVIIYNEITLCLEPTMKELLEIYKKEKGL